MSTPSQEDGGGNSVQYLDRQNVDCNGKPLAQFQLSNANGGISSGKYSYDYTCGSVQLQNLQTKTTPMNDRTEASVYLEIDIILIVDPKCYLNLI